MALKVWGLAADITTQEVVSTLSQFPRVGVNVANTEMLLLDHTLDDTFCFCNLVLS